MSSKADEVFLIANNDIRPLASRPFKAGLFGTNLEDALQTLIERQPNIINGRQIEPGSADPPRFVLLRREMQVGDWSLDHLLVDQRGVLTFVEAKLLQNPEARRAVIGQILDYAAYAAENWTNGRLKQLAQDYWRSQHKDLSEVLNEAFGEIDLDAFWNDVELNLAQSRIRLIIVADELRPEVRRVIEFLNEQLRTIQIFGLEIRCFGEEPNAVIVPFLIGQTQAAAAQKVSTGGARNWTVDELRTAYFELPDDRLGHRLTRILDWALNRGCITIPGDTKSPVFGLAGKNGQQIVSVSTTYIYSMLRESRYLEQGERDRFVEDLRKLKLYPSDFTAISIRDGKSLSIKLEDMDENQFAGFLEVLGRYCIERSTTALG